MALTDEQVERYSRQLILPEVGPGGQERLGAARVAVVGEGAAAEAAVAYLAAAGVGWIAAAPALQRHADAAQADLVLAPLPTTPGPELDAAIVTAERIDTASAAVATWRARAPQIVWVAENLVGGSPPCPACAAAALARGTRSDEPTAVRDALLGTIAATEIVKTLLGIGTSIVGRVLAYDADGATIESVDVAARCSCACAPIS